MNKLKITSTLKKIGKLIKNLDILIYISNLKGIFLGSDDFVFSLQFSQGFRNIWTAVNTMSTRVLWRYFSLDAISDGAILRRGFFFFFFFLLLFILWPQVYIPTHAVKRGGRTWIEKMDSTSSIQVDVISTQLSSSKAFNRILTKIFFFFFFFLVKVRVPKIDPFSL